MMKNRIQVIKPEYVFVQLKPNNSLRNNSTHLIARTVANMYKSFWGSRIFEDEKLFRFWKFEKLMPTKVSFKRNGKVSYFIYMEKEKIEFYFIIPQHVYSVIKEKISGVWTGVTVKVVDSLPTFSENSFKYQMVYEKEDGLSLTTNRTDNDLLNASLNVVDLLEDGDKAGILYNFIPMSQKGFKYSYNSTIQKVKDNRPIERKKTGWTYLFKMGISFVDSLIREVSEALAGKPVTKEESVFESIIERLNGGNKITESTVKKIKGQVVETQIVVMSESKERINEISHANSIAQSFDVLSGDNRLVKEKFNGPIDYKKTRIPKVKTNKMWDEEIQSLVSIAGREILERYSFMEQVKTQETLIPHELQTGTMCIGDTTFRGSTQKAYLSNDRDYKNLMLLLIGPSRAGKSNLISHLAIDAIENDECVIMFDFIKNCKLSRDVAACFPKEKVLEVSFEDVLKIQGLGYNEVGMSDDPFKMYENAKRQTSNTLALINAINDGSGDKSNLTPKMERYLECSCLVAYVTGGSIKDIFGMQLNHLTRHKFINAVPSELNEYLQDYIDGLRELDEIKQGEIVGTKVQAGIIDRLNVLKRNAYMEMMLKKGTENNINFVDEMQKSQLIVIKMPEAKFTTNAEKDIICTYFMTKVWLALQVRGDMYEDEASGAKKVNLIIDEIYQVNNCEKFLSLRLAQIAKFGMKPIISCHYINQILSLRPHLRSANASYMLVSGCDKTNYKELKEELRPFELEDLENLDRYHSMNYIKAGEGYARFITELPEKVELRVNRKKKEKNN